MIIVNNQLQYALTISFSCTTRGGCAAILLFALQRADSRHVVRTQLLFLQECMW